MNLRDTIKKIWFSLNNTGRVVLLNHAIIPNPTYGIQEGHPHRKLFELISANRSSYNRVLENTLLYKDKFATIVADKTVKDERDPGWNNDYLPGLDIIMLYSLLAQIKPSKYIEIGSGTSTKLAYKTRNENSLNFEIISIDPAPRKTISKVADTVHQQQVQSIDPVLFETLSAGDVLFFDGTHLLYPNSDVMWFFLEILPRLTKGVVVHIHDIYLPFDYPDFMLTRYYNEEYILGALLLACPEKYEIISPNYFIYSDKSLHQVLNPIWGLGNLSNVEKHGGSFWFRIL